MKKFNEIGFLKGEVCNRDNCKGIIEEYKTDKSCRCHLNPPCSYCTEDRHYCPECGWEAESERIQEKNPIHLHEEIKYRTLKDLDSSKIDYIHIKTGNSTMTFEGVYPEGTTRKELFEKLKGSFGGRIDRFCNGKFTFVAYTD